MLCFSCNRDVVYKNGIRTTEFFRDHDKLRSGIITENQFICGLSLCLGQRAQLQREEIHKIVEHYRSSDGRVKYKEFCDLMENSKSHACTINIQLHATCISVEYN